METNYRTMTKFDLGYYRFMTKDMPGGPFDKQNWELWHKPPKSLDASSKFWYGKFSPSAEGLKRLKYGLDYAIETANKDFIILDRLAEMSIVGLAYGNAMLRWNLERNPDLSKDYSDGKQLITFKDTPPMDYFACELKKLCDKVYSRGDYLSEEITRIVDDLASEYLPIVRKVPHPAKK